MIKNKHLALSKKILQHHRLIAYISRSHHTDNLKIKVANNSVSQEVNPTITFLNALKPNNKISRNELRWPIVYLGGLGVGLTLMCFGLTEIIIRSRSADKSKFPAPELLSTAMVIGFVLVLGGLGALYRWHSNYKHSQLVRSLRFIPHVQLAYIKEIAKHLNIDLRMIYTDEEVIRKLEPALNKIALNDKRRLAFFRKITKK